MSITSFYFLALVTVGVLVYYVVPKSIQWMILLVLSAVFYYFAATPCTIGYLVVSTMIAYLSTMWIQKKRDALGREAKGLLVVTFVKVKSFAPRQIQRRSFAALAITLSRKIF